MIKTENAIEIPKDRSNNHVGMGSINTARIAMIPKARAMSLLFAMLVNEPRLWPIP